MRYSVRPGSPGDFFSAIVLLITAAFVLQQSALIHTDAGVTLAVSPALLPLFLGFCLLLCSLILLSRSLKSQKAGVVASAVMNNIIEWFQSPASDWRRMIGGIALLGAYIFFLIPIFEFWLSTSLFLISILAFLRATSLWKIGLLTIGSVGGIILLFQVIFKVSLP